AAPAPAWATCLGDAGRQIRTPNTHAEGGPAGRAAAANVVARLGSVRWRLPGNIVSAAFAPDGQTLAVRLGDNGAGPLRLLHVATGKELRRLTGEASGSGGVTAFSPAARFLLSRPVKLSIFGTLLPASVCTGWGPTSTTSRHWHSRPTGSPWPPRA